MWGFSASKLYGRFVSAKAMAKYPFGRGREMRCAATQLRVKDRSQNWVNNLTPDSELAPTVAASFLLRRLGQKSHQVVDLILKLRLRTHVMRRALGFVPGRILEIQNAILNQFARGTRDRRSLAAGQVGIAIMASHAGGHVRDSPPLCRRQRLRRTARRHCYREHRRAYAEPQSPMRSRSEEHTSDSSHL